MEKRNQFHAQAVQVLTQYIERNGMRKTPERFEVLRWACNQEGLFSIDQLDAVMHAEGKFQVSRVTLFNTLEMFVEMGLFTKHLLKRAALYECTMHRSPRILEVCDECGMVKEMKQDKLYRMLRDLKVRSFVLQQPVLYLHGLCSKCNRARKHQKRGKQE